MHKRLYSFSDTYEISYPLQFGFSEKHSTTQALLSLTESIKHSIDNGKYGCRIFLDFSENTPLPKLSYLLLSQSNILLTMVKMVAEFFLTCRKLLTL